MPTWVYPAWPIRFEDLAGNGIDFPTEAMEWETSQSLRTAFEEIPMADYQYDLLGTRRAPRDLATESIRFVKIGNSGPEVFAWIQQLRALLARVGRGRLWIRDGNGTRYWAYARPTEMPDVTFGVEEIRHVPVTVRFARLSDWYAETESVAEFLVRTSPTTVFLNSSGTVETKRLTIRFGMPYTPTDLSVSGVVIDDAIRSQTVPAHFDGRAPESSVGIWRGTTNLVVNGSFETDTNGWQGDAGVTLTRDMTTARHGAASLKVMTDGTVTEQGAWTPPAGSYMAVADEQTYTLSCWATGSGTIYLKVAWYDSSGAWLGDSNSAPISLTSSWQRYTFTATAPLNATQARIAIRTPSTQTTTFWIDAVQFEQAPFATPYVHTDGATASRPRPHLWFPPEVANQILDETQGWVAVRARPAVNYSQLPSGYYLPLFAWRNNWNTPRMLMRLWSGSSDQDLVLSMDDDSAGQSVTIPASTISAGQAFLAIGAWTQQQIKLSLNGGAFSSQARTVFPNLSTVRLDIGSQWADTDSTYLQGELLWFACGTGTLTDADAAALAALGDSDPQPSDFPVTSQLTCLWTCTRISGWSIVNPVIEKPSETMKIQIMRTLSSRDEIVEIDCQNNRVRYSNDNGVTWSDDWPNVIIGDTQVELFSVSPGTNDFRISFDASSADPEFVVTIRWHDAFA